jgi:hypothetical protein
MEKQMTDMVEKVAEAIQQASFRMIRPGWEALDESEKDHWRMRARAAIEVIPTGKQLGEKLRQLINDAERMKLSAVSVASLLDLLGGAALKEHSND